MARTLKEFVHEHDDRDALRNRIIDEMLRNGPTCDLNHLDVSHTTNMEGLFQNLDFRGDVSRWNVSNVATMESMFSGCTFNGDISNWNVSNVTNMQAMFARSQFNGVLSHWNTSAVRHMDHMFASSYFNQDIANWDISSVETMGHMFSYSNFNRPLEKWNVENVHVFDGMFAGSVFNQNLSLWRIAPLASTAAMLMGLSFQSSLPQIHATEKTKPVLDKMYRGDLHNKYTFWDAMFLFSGGQSAAERYLDETAVRGLSLMHASRAMNLFSTPAWMEPDVFAWLKEQETFCYDLGMSYEQTAALVYEQYQRKYIQKEVVPNALFDFSEIVSA